MPCFRAMCFARRPAAGPGVAGEPPRRARWWAPAIITCGAILVAACGPTASGAGSPGSGAGSPGSGPSGSAVQASARPTGSSPSAAAYSGNPGPGWNLTWSDDFTGSSALSDWTFVNGGNGWGNKQLQVYDTRNASLAPGGGLVITAAKDGYGEPCWYGTCTYSAARLDTKGIFAQKYGIFEARIKLPSGRGLWPAFWMEGADIDQAGWPASGEIDVIEINNMKPDLVEAFAHAPAEKYGAYFQLPTSLSAGYHIYGVDWTATGITWLVDGHAYGHLSAYQGWPFDQPFFLILDLAVGGTWPGSPTAETTFPAQMDVSWIRVYQQKS